MIQFLHGVKALIMSITLTLLASATHAQDMQSEIRAVVRDYLASNPEEVQRIVRDYIRNNPELLGETIDELMKRRRAMAAKTTAANAEQRSAAIKINESALFQSPHHAVLGNANGEITLIEFFDYNCGFCKRALSDKLALLKQHPNLRIVLKEFPILGVNSLEAARVSVAARLQSPDDATYLDFHKRLLETRGAVDRARAVAVAQEVGLDVSRLARDIDGDEIRVGLDESLRLAKALGLTGTPSYVVGDSVIVGAVGLATLTERINAVRK